MGSSAYRAAKVWEIEVDIEAAQLIEAGMPPYQAHRRAVEIVSERRRKRSEEVRNG